jgi:hypothetical protein
VKLYRIIAPKFKAILIAKDGKIRSATPVVKYMRGWEVSRMIGYAQSKGWQTGQVLEDE